MFYHVSKYIYMGGGQLILTLPASMITLFSNSVNSQ